MNSKPIDHAARRATVARLLYEQKLLADVAATTQGAEAVSYLSDYHVPAEPERWLAFELNGSDPVHVVHASTAQELARLLDSSPWTRTTIQVWDLDDDRELTAVQRVVSFVCGAERIPVRPPSAPD